MEDDYWTLFCTTGIPVFYLLHRYESERKQEVRTAWCAQQAELL